MAALRGDRTLDKLFEEWNLGGKKLKSIDIHIPHDGVVEIKVTCIESSGLLKKFTEAIQGYTLAKNEIRT